MLHSTVWTTIRLACLIAATASGCKGSATQHEAAALAAFDAFKGAVASRDGARAAALVGPETRQRYAALAAAARDADRATLTEHPLLEQLITLRLRHATPTLAGADGRTALSALVSRGAVGDLAGFGIVDASVDGDTARAKLTLDDHALPIRLRIVRTDAGWHVELVDLFSVIDEVLVKVPEQLGVAATQYVEDVLRNELPDAPADVWAPPR